MLAGRLAWNTQRTSGLSMPMPKAMVAAMTTPDSVMKTLWVEPRVALSRPVWQGHARTPCFDSCSAADSVLFVRNSVGEIQSVQIRADLSVLSIFEKQ